MRIFDRLIDLAFGVDIIINFRTMYRNSHTNELVRDSKRIAIHYVLYGRFGIDLVASLPLEAMALIFQTTSSSLKFLRILKLTRLLRLRRIISFLVVNQTVKFGFKITQVVLCLILISHWLDCVWYYTTNNDQTWFPPKDLDFRETEAYTAGLESRYALFYYYGMIIITGNEVLPTNYLEI